MVLLTTESENHIREMELCLKMRPWAESFGNLHAGACIKSPERRVSDEGCGVCASIYQRAVHVSAVRPDYLQSGSFELGVRRSEMKKYAYDAGEMILAPRHVDHWFRTDDLHLLVVGNSDAALTAACDGGQADLHYGAVCTSRAVT